MTEITANIEPTRAIRPLPFLAALVLGPPAFTAPFVALGFAQQAVELNSNGLMLIAVIPLGALLFGAIPYLIFGTPAFLIALRHGASTTGAAFLANLAAAPAIFVVFAIAKDPDSAIGTTLFVLFYGSIFAPIWGAVFGCLYRLFSGETRNV